MKKGQNFLTFFCNSKMCRYIIFIFTAQMSFDYINIHTHKSTNKQNVLAIENATFDLNNDNNSFSLGIHPWFIIESKINEHLDILKNALNSKKCMALGECGIDKNIKFSLELQKEVFLKQLEINTQFNKPAIIHCVKSFQEIILIRNNYSFPFIIHGFNKKSTLANQLIDKGFYLSFGKTLIENKRLQSVFKEIPLHYIFLETDDANIEIETIYKKAAEIKQISLEELILTIKINLKKVFK